MKSKMCLFFKYFILSHLLLLSFISCKFYWFEDFSKILEDETTVNFNFYVSDESDVYFTRKYIIGSRLTVDQLPDANDKNVKSLNPGFTLRSWKFYRTTEYHDTYIPYDIECDDGGNIVSLIVSNQDWDFYADWDYATDTKYTVEYYFQPVSGSTNKDSYELKSEYTQHLEGTTNSPTEASTIEVLGFTCEPVTQKTINADNSTVVKVYLNRETYTIRLIDSSSATTSEVSGLYESEVEYTLPERLGYRISGYKEISSGKIINTLPIKMPAGDVSYEIVWETIPVKYTVIHYLQNIDDDEYSEYDSEEKEGQVGENTEAAAKTIPGFDIPTVVQKIITADGLTVVEIKYNRKNYSITFDFNGGNDNGSINPIVIDVRYNGSVSDLNKSTIESLNLSKQGFIFVGWSNNQSSNIGKPFEEISLDNITESINYYAIWRAVGELPIQVILPSVQDNTVLNLEVDASNGSDITASVDSGYASYKWLFDGVYDPSSTTNTYTHSLPDKNGYYEVMVIVTDSSGNIYTAEFQLRYQKN